MTEDLVIIVTGGRTFSKPWRVHLILDSYMPTRVVEGGCPRGADLFARQWCVRHGLRTRSYPVTDDDWKRYGKYAGIRRNGIMLRDWAKHPNVRVIAFPVEGGRGTQDCIYQARDLGLIVENYGDVEV